MVTMVNKHAEFVGPFGRHGRNLRTIEPCLRTVLRVYMFKKIEQPSTCEMGSVILFLNARNKKPADIHCQLCEVYGEHALSDSMVRRWVRHFNKGREYVHDDPPMATHL
jgi:hypothetical protein